MWVFMCNMLVEDNLSISNPRKFVFSFHPNDLRAYIFCLIKVLLKHSTELWGL